MNKRVLLIYPPLTSNSSDFLPSGILQVAQSLREESAEVRILNLDVERLTSEEMIKRIKSFDPGIVGFSAVTSTTYLFIKQTVDRIKRRINKDIHILVGGNIVANSEVLVNDAKVDTCFLGESYWTLKEFFAAYDFQHKILPEEKANKIRGIVYKNKDQIVYTGVRKLCNIQEIPLLKNFEGIDTEYYFPLLEKMDFRRYSEEAKKKIKALPEKSRYICTMFCSGCQNRCSFCHRNIPGIRQRNVKDIFEYIDYLTARFNIRFINFCDESLFFKEEWLYEFTQALLKRNLVYKFAGVRADQVVKQQKYLKQMAEHGLVDIAVGLESGSGKMLKIMNKNVTVDENIKAIEIINKLNIFHVPQIIIGMPGENPASIKETLNMTVKCKTNHSLSSINIIQVLPGTPVYWFAQKNRRVIDEIAYIEAVSDKNPTAEGTVNVTEYSMAIMEYAQFHITHKVKFNKGWYGPIIVFIYDFLFLLAKMFQRGEYSVREKFSLGLYAVSGKTFKTHKYSFPLLSSSLRKELRKEVGILNQLDKIKFGY